MIMMIMMMLMGMMMMMMLGMSGSTLYNCNQPASKPAGDRSIQSSLIWQCFKFLMQSIQLYTIATNQPAGIGYPG